MLVPEEAVWKGITRTPRAVQFRAATQAHRGACRGDVKSQREDQRVRRRFEAVGVTAARVVELALLENVLVADWFAWGRCDVSLVPGAVVS